jgi:hypothetical protein
MQYATAAFRGYAAVVATAIFVATASASPGQENRELIVVLDSWWSHDYAKNACSQAESWYKYNRDDISNFGCKQVDSCPEMMARFTACVVDPIPEVVSFEDKLATQFAVNRQYAGVFFAQFSGPHAQIKDGVRDAMQKPHYTLIIDHTPGLPKQSWSLQRSFIPPEVFMEGEGNPKEIARDVCAIVTKQGAIILQ